MLARLLLLVGLASIPAVAPAAADGGSCPGGQACLLVTVTGATQQQYVVTADDLDAWHDLGAAKLKYRTHSPGSTQNEPRPDQATSVPAILGRLSVPVASVTFISAKASPDAHTTRLDPGDLSDATTPDTGFQDNAVPGFWADTDRQLVRFARPMRSDDDLNYEDVWTSRTDGTATLVVHTTGHIVHPQIRSSTATTTVGTSVGLSATFTDDPPPAGPTYAWAFGDGSTSTGATPQHTWSKAGTYEITLETGAADGSEGSAVPVRVQVGPKPPPKAPVKSPGTGTGPKHHPVTGPKQSTGTTSKGSTDSSTNSSSLGGLGDLGGDFTNGSTSGLGTIDPQTSTPSTAPTPSQVTGSGDQVLPEGTPVSGVLLVANTTSAASASTPTTAGSSSAVSARAVPRLGADRGLLWLLLLPVLLVLGGGTQTRWWLRRLPTLPWRTG